MAFRYRGCSVSLRFSHTQSERLGWFLSNDALLVLGPAKALKRQGSQLIPFLNSIACARRGPESTLFTGHSYIARKQERTDSEVQPSESTGLWRSDDIALLVECADTLIQNQCSILQHDLEKSSFHEIVFVFDGNIDDYGVFSAFCSHAPIIRYHCIVSLASALKVPR